jgi:hypothetical protein
MIKFFSSFLKYLVVIVTFLILFFSRLWKAADLIESIEKERR